MAQQRRWRAVYFWLDHDLPEIADAGLTDEVTEKITDRINRDTDDASRAERRRFVQEFRDGGLFGNICRFSVARPRFEDAE